MHPRKRLLAVFVAALLIPTTAALAVDDPAAPEPRIISLDNEPRIIGGNDADPGEYPHQVGLIAAGFEGNIWGGQFCGGALIDSLWVMTAAHCVDGKTPSSLFVYADSYDLNGGGTSITVTAIFMHEQYNSSTVENDIALLQLDSPASSEPIRYATPDDAALFAAGTDPHRPGGSLTIDESEALLDAVHRVLAAGIQAGGTTLDDMAYLLPNGRSGEFITELAVYGREGEPRPRCGDAVRRDVIRSRSTFWSPGCQG